MSVLHRSGRLGISSAYVQGFRCILEKEVDAVCQWGNFYARSILGLPLRDVTGGFRLWRRELLERIPYEQVVSNGYVFLVEILYLAHQQGCRFGEVPIYFADRKWGQSKMNLRNQFEAAWRVWQVKWRYRSLSVKHVSS